MANIRTTDSYWDDLWTKHFHLCSEYYIKSNDESLTKKERDSYFDKWHFEIRFKTQVYGK